MKLKCLLFSVLVVLANHNAYSKEVHSFNGAIELATENDSTVVVDEIDNVARDSSSSWKYKLNARYRYRPYEHTKASLSFTFSDKNYKQDDSFNSELRMFSASISREFEHFTLGLRAQDIDSKLGGQDFLTIEQVSPYLTFFLSKKWFVNLSYRHADKEIVSNSSRSGDSDLFNADLYFFQQGVRQFWIASVRHKSEQAQDPIFSYDLQQFRLVYSQRFDWWQWQHKLRLSWRFQERDYDSAINPDLNDFRRDIRRQWRFEWEAEFHEDWFLILELKRNDNNSNFTTSDYNQNVTGLALKYEF